MRAALEAVLVEHFVEIARAGYQFERFEDAWCAWADADAAIDWTEERLQDTVVEILGAGVITPDVDHETLCTCAATILADLRHALPGVDGRQARRRHSARRAHRLRPAGSGTVRGAHLRRGRRRGDPETLLRQRYATYTEVSYRLHVLVHALADLRNTYPRATLHDCDEGSDFNPVRLGQTALGSN